MMYALLLITLNLPFVHSVLPWSYQQSLFVPYANKTYGDTPPLLVGRGFLTLISGYDPFRPGIFVHTTDDGYVSGSKVVWSQQAVLRPTDPLTASDGFGKVMVGYNQTLIVAAPYRINRRGAVYVFNGKSLSFLSLLFLACSLIYSEIYSSFILLTKARSATGRRSSA